jgi:hypothetical protein
MLIVLRDDYDGGGQDIPFIALDIRNIIYLKSKIFNGKEILEIGLKFSTYLEIRNPENVRKVKKAYINKGRE